MTDCAAKKLEFQALGARKVEAAFDGGSITTDAGGLLLREVEQKRGWIKQLTQCFEDGRSQAWVEHTLESLLSQRIFGVALGYEDLNDHDQLRKDPLLAVVCGKADPCGEDRQRPQDRGKALAGKSTLNRLELAGTDRDARYKKIVMRESDVERLLVDIFLSRHSQAPECVVLDLDATDSPIHGQQEGRFFHGYYGNYCYLPLYIFCGDEILVAKLRPSDRDASAGALEEVQRVVTQLRGRWPGIQIVLRADSGFARDAIMSWCEDHGVDYLFGLARNSRLEEVLREPLKAAKVWHDLIAQPVRVYHDFQYQTRESWTRERRVIGKAEYTQGEANPRFIVTTLRGAAKKLYEQDYCGRGDMENRIKEQQLYLFADRTSAETMRANQFRLWVSAFAYVFVHEIRDVGLVATEMARAQCHTIRNKLFKIGAQVQLSVRRIVVHLASGYPWQDIFIRSLGQLRQAYALRT